MQSEVSPVSPLANSYDFREVQDEDLSIAHIPGVRFGDLRIEYSRKLGVRDDDFHLHFGQKIDCLLGSTIFLLMTTLTAESKNFSDGQSMDADCREG